MAMMQSGRRGPPPEEDEELNEFFGLPPGETRIDGGGRRIAPSPEELPRNRNTTPVPGMEYNDQGFQVWNDRVLPNPDGSTAPQPDTLPAMWDSAPDLQNTSPYTAVFPDRDTNNIPDQDQPENQPPPVETPAAPTGPDPKRLQFTDRYNQARQNALKYGRDRLSAMGMEDDPYGIMDMYTGEVDRLGQNLFDHDPDPNIYWNESISDPATIFSGYQDSFNSVLGERRGRERRSLMKRFESPYGNADAFSEELIPDTYDDSFVNSLLDPQYQDALGHLERARGRGMLNDNGFNTARTRLDSDKARAASEVGLFSSNLLNTGRDKIRDTIGDFRSKLDDWDFGDTTDFEGLGSRINSRKSSFDANFNNQLQSQFGSRNFFDPGAIVSSSRRNQLSSEGGGGNLFDTMQADELRRSRGTTGAF